MSHNPNNTTLVTDEELDVIAKQWMDTIPPTITETMNKSVSLSRNMVSWDLMAKWMKMNEELGEFAETALYEQGFNQHKPRPKEDSFGESADLILCIVDVLSLLHKDMTPREIIAWIGKAMDTKYKKWETRIKDLERKTNDKPGENQQLSTNVE